MMGRLTDAFLDSSERHRKHAQNWTPHRVRKRNDRWSQESCTCPSLSHQSTELILLLFVLFALFVFSKSFATVESRQPCIDYNATDGRLSKLGATPAAHVSGGQIPPSSNKEKGTAAAKSLQRIIAHLPAVHRLSRQLASPGKGGASPDARVKRTVRFSLLKTTASKKRHKHRHSLFFFVLFCFSPSFKDQMKVTGEPQEHPASCCQDAR